MQSASSYRPRRTLSGFTLIELMIGLALVAVLLGIAAPTFREAMMNVRISAQANDLFTDLALARSEAVKRNVPVLVCPSANGTDCTTGWTNGWLIFADANRNNAKDANEPTLKRRGQIEGSNTLAAAGTMAAGSMAYVPYAPSGISTPTGVDFVLCDTRTRAGVGRRISILPTGRPLVRKINCPLVPSLDDL